MRKLSPLIIAVLLTACATDPVNRSTAADNNTNTSFRQYIEATFDAYIRRSPMALQSLGDQSRNDEWDDFSPEFQADTAAWRQQVLKEFTRFDREELNEDNQLNYDLFLWQLESGVASDRFPHHGYPVNQLFGVHAAIVTQLTNLHRISTVHEAKAYLTRLENLPGAIDQIIARLEQSRRAGVIAPRFALEGAAAQIEQLLRGAPLETDAEAPNIIAADFQRKIDALDATEMTDVERALLMQRLNDALLGNYRPAFVKLLTTVENLAAVAENRGVWSLPDGDDYYRLQLRQMTTTDLSPEQIHDLGMREIGRIHAEMRALMPYLQFEGTLEALFEYSLNDPRFYYEDSEVGRAEALADATRIVEDFRPRLKDLFATQPAAPVEIRAVEPFRAANAAAAFYERGTPDGSRPGVYYLNLHNPKLLPKYRVAAITYHEAIPGHHMQASIAQEQSNLPAFRRFMVITPYAEGWGLYSELLPWEIGFYQDPWDNYGRLVMELLRAVRLATDTGIHHMRWTQDEAIDFVVENLPVTRASAKRSVQRFFVLPGQATAYKIGQLKILELREFARRELGEDFDIREFHEVILTHGTMPLSLLEDMVERWVANKRRGG